MASPSGSGCWCASIEVGPARLSSSKRAAPGAMLAGTEERKRCASRMEGRKSCAPARTARRAAPRGDPPVLVRVSHLPCGMTDPHRGAAACDCLLDHQPQLVVVTGGPGGGKTALLELARRDL